MGAVDADAAAVISTAHPGSSEVAPCVWPVPVVDYDDNDVSWREITDTARVLVQDGGILSAWRV